MTNEELERFSYAASAHYRKLQQDFEERMGKVIDGMIGNISNQTIPQDAMPSMAARIKRFLQN